MSAKRFCFKGHNGVCVRTDRSYNRSPETNEMEIEVNVNRLKENMRKFLLPCLMCLATLGTQALAESDFVYRPEVEVSGPLTGSLFWKAAINPRLSSNAQEADEIGLVAGLYWKQNKHLSLSSDFKYIGKGGTDQKNESRPRFAAELSAPLGKLNVALRNRFEYRMKEGEDEYWRYRVRIRIKFPKLGRTTPFIYEEVLYEFGDIDELNKNEAGLGISLPVGKNLGLDLDLRFVNAKKNGDWEIADKHLLTVLKYSF